MERSLEYYKVFYFVAKNRNITAAARELYLSQPTVSKYIKALEEELHCTLFLRSKKGVALTPEAKRLYEHISVAYMHIEKAEEELAESKTMKKGVVRIGASEMTMRNFLLPYLQRFRESYPEIKLKISGLTTPKAVEMLKAGLIDFAVIVSPVEDETVKVESLVSFEDIFVAPATLFAQGKRPTTLTEISQYPLICLEEGTTTRTHLEKIFEKEGVLLRPDIVLDSTDLIVPSVLHGLGIGFVPKVFAQTELENWKLDELKLQNALPKRQICLVSNPQYPLSIGSKAFIELLCQPNLK